MSVRDVAILGLLGGGAYVLWRSLGNVDLSAPQPLMDATGAGGSVSGSYFDKLAMAEDLSGDPLAKNPISSASGLWQFVKKTWTNLGGAWGPDPTKAFGGLTPSVAEQNAMLAKLTASNATALSNAGIVVTDATLYAAHLFGPNEAIRVLKAPGSADLASIVGNAAVSGNRLPATVSGFMSWLQGKMG